MPKSIFVAILFILFYFLILRPVRSEINKVVLKPIVEQSIVNSNSRINLTSGSSVSSIIVWGDISNPTTLYLKVPFGINFLIGIIGLLVIRGNKQFYWALIAIQFFGGLSAFLTFYIGTVSSANFLIITDLIMRYLMPLCSLGIVPLAIIFKRQQQNERKA